MSRSSMSVVVSCCSLLMASAVATANPVTLYSSGFEAPTYTQGLLGTQDGWELDSGTDFTVTSAFARTGSQSLVYSGTDLFGVSERVGPFPSALPRVSVKHSIYLDATKTWGDTFIAFAAWSPTDFVGQLAIENGSVAVLGGTSSISTTPITLGQWIDLELVLDFQSQTMEGFVNGVSMGSGAFANAATQVGRGDLFFTNFNFAPPQDITFYVDDVSFTAIPAPGSLAAIAGAGLVFGRRRR